MTSSLFHSTLLRSSSSSSFARFLSSSSPLPPLPKSVDTVVIGGGIIGASTAFHLADLGQNVLLLEKDRLTSGTTWHAAGLMVTFGSLSHTSTDWRKYTKELFSKTLPDLTGMDVGFKQCGFIELATSEDTLEEYRRISAFNRCVCVLFSLRFLSLSFSLCVSVSSLLSPSRPALTRLSLFPLSFSLSLPPSPPPPGTRE